MFNSPLTPLALVLLCGLVFTLGVHHASYEQTASRVREAERRRDAVEAERAREQAARRQALRAWAAAAARTARVAALPGDPAKGRALYGSCASCHGRRGEGKQVFYAPRLAGMEPWYVRSQLVKFMQGVRGSHPQDIYGMEMAQAAQALPTEASVDHVVAYIASLALDSGARRAGGDAAAGRRHYTTCIPCHGPDARGLERQRAPALTGQPAWYLEKQLADFKSGVRGGHERDIEGQQMIAAMQPVDAGAFADLIAYIRSL